MPGDLIAQLVKLESDVLYQVPASDKEPEYLHLPGTIPVLVSAPHGAVHTRDYEKEEDDFTAGLAQLVGARTGAHVLYARRKSKSDPNATPNAPYKKSLLKISQAHQIGFVLDIHGAKADRNFGVALGTMHGKSCSAEEKQLIIHVFDRHGLTTSGLGTARLDVDDQLPSEGSQDRETVTRFCHQNELPAAQIEINARLRIPRRPKTRLPGGQVYSNQEQIQNLVETLCDLTLVLAENTSQRNEQARSR